MLMSDLPPGGCTPTAFGWSCSNIEERYFAAVSQQGEEEHAEHERAVDMAERLAGPCERCQEPQGDVLEVVGGEALCDDCIRWEKNDDV